MMELVASRLDSSGICRSASDTSVGADRASESPMSEASDELTTHGSVGRASSPWPEVACSLPLRGSCSSSSTHRPPVTAAAR